MEIGLSQERGRPDGMTIDNVGNLWIAKYVRSEVIRCVPKSGDRIGVPARSVRTCCFGGNNMRTL